MILSFAFSFVKVSNLRSFHWKRLKLRQFRTLRNDRKKLLGWILLAREGSDALVQPQGTIDKWHPEPLCDAAMEGRLFDLRWGGGDDGGSVGCGMCGWHSHDFSWESWGV